MTRFLLEGNSRLLFSEPGTGKTRSVIDSTDALTSGMDIKGSLIIAPKRVAVLTWPDEIAKWSSHNVADMRSEAGAKAWKDGTASYYVINIDRLPWFCEKFLGGKDPIPVDQVVFDECHRIRNPTGVRAKKFMKCRDQFKRFVGMTGTPTPNSPLELFNQVRMMDGGESLGKVWTHFQRTHAYSDYLGYKWTLLPGAADRIYEKIAHMTLVQRAADWLDIPPVSVHDIEVSLDEETMKKYRELEKESLLLFREGEVVADTAATLVGKLRQMTSGFIYGIEDGQKVVIPAHGDKLAALGALHKKLDYDPLLIFIQYNHERDHILKAFPEARIFDEKDIGKWNDGKIPMWVAHPRSAGEGLNLQKPCANVCWFSQTYSSAEYNQGNSRVARTGQTRETRIWRLIVPDTIDEAVVEVVRKKVEGQNAAFSALRALSQLKMTP
jgi:SNF2-related domain